MAGISLTLGSTAMDGTRSACARPHLLVASFGMFGLKHFVVFVSVVAVLAWGLIGNASAQTSYPCAANTIPNWYVSSCPDEYSAYARATADAQAYFAANPKDAYGRENQLCQTIKTPSNGPYVWVASVPTIHFNCMQANGDASGPVFRASFPKLPPSVFDFGKNNQCGVQTGPETVVNPVGPEPTRVRRLDYGSEWHQAPWRWLSLGRRTDGVASIPGGI